MSYNPVAASTSSAIKEEAARYSKLYAVQGIKHVQYSWILWCAIGAVLAFMLVFRLLSAIMPQNGAVESVRRLCSRSTIFGRNVGTSRIQVVLLAAYLAYNTIFSFVDIPYGSSWRYTSKHAPGYIQTATVMQFIANRTGYLAFASVPLVFLLVSRYNVITLCTGVSYNALNLVHRWVGWTVFVLTWLHTLLWTIEMGVNYDMQGGYLATRWRKLYWLGGFFATLLLCWVCLHSLSPVRRYTGYEFFRITHHLGAVLFVIGCWVHWPAACQWIAAAIAIYYADHLLRWRAMVYHYLRAGGTCELTGTVYSDEDQVDVGVLQIANSGLRTWSTGQHVYLYCLSLSEWEPHPFSVANCGHGKDILQLIVRRQNGMTSELLATLQYKSEPVRVIIDGPYGALDQSLIVDRTCLLIAGGTGISFILSVLHGLASSHSSDKHIHLLWYVRRRANLQWAADELEKFTSVFGTRLRIDVIVTRETPGPSSASSIADELGKDDSAIEISKVRSFLHTTPRDANMTLEAVIPNFVARHEKHEKLSIIGCGPGSMGSEIQKMAEHSSYTNVRCHVDQYCI